MDRIFSRIICNKKRFLRHQISHLPWCVNATQNVSLQQVVPSKYFSHPKLCHNDATSPDPTQYERDGVKIDAQEVLRDGKGTDESTHSSRTVESKLSSAKDISQDVALKGTGKAAMKTGSSSFAESTSSSSKTISSDPMGKENILHTSESSKQTLSDEEKPKRKEPPVAPDPETCCESGCVNCVWIKYAEEVKEYYPDHEERIKEILEMIEDYNVKMFVRMELASKK